MLHPRKTPKHSSWLGFFSIHKARAALNIGHRHALAINEPIDTNPIRAMIPTIMPKYMYDIFVAATYLTLLIISLNVFMTVSILSTKIILKKA